MKNKVVVALVAVALAALMIVGGTLAWFTDKDTATNVVTLGNIDIELTEPTSGGTENDTNGKDYTAMPGAVLDKDPTVSNIGDNDAYVRLAVSIDVVENAAYTALSDADKKTVNDNLAELLSKIEYKTDFAKVGDYFYYVANNGVMAGKDGTTITSATLFDQVKIPGADWTNEMANIQFNIVVNAEAVQVDNNEAEIAEGATASEIAAAIATVFDGVTIEGPVAAE